MVSKPLAPERETNVLLINVLFELEDCKNIEMLEFEVPVEFAIVLLELENK